MARLRRQGASIDLAAAPYRYSPATVACVTLIATVVGALLTGCALLMTGVALAMDLMLLVPLIALPISCCDSSSAGCRVSRLASRTLASASCFHDHRVEPVTLIVFAS
jgi:hypothetical protein